MLLFSALLEINDSMTKDAFVKLVIEWNQGSPHHENRIPGMQWNGEYNIRYGSDTLWMGIEEYRNQNIIAVRYEKIENDGVVWDTDYVMNFNDMKMSIRLDRSYLEEALSMDAAFSTPHFITLLIEHGYIKDDGTLPVLRSPYFIKSNNLGVLADVINGQAKYRIPVVYVSKTAEGADPVDIWKLAGRLKGVAHVLVEESLLLNSSIRKQCADKNEYYGAIGVYFPNSAYGHRKFLYRTYDGIDAILAEKVIRSVIQYCNAQMVDTLYTWQGVNNALLRDRLDSRSAELLTVEKEKARAAEETDQLLELGDADIRRLKSQVEELTRANEALAYENQGLRAKIESTDGLPVLYFGDEDEFFPNEIRLMLLDALKEALSRCAPGSRRRDVLADIISKNNCQHVIDERAAELKTLLKGYKNVSGSMKRTLQDLGFTISEEGKHYKLTYYGDGRYMITLAKTPSDGRSGLNIVTTIIKNML